MKPRQASPLKQPPSQVRTLAAGLCCDLRAWGADKVHSLWAGGHFLLLAHSARMLGVDPLCTLQLT